MKIYHLALFGLLSAGILVSCTPSSDDDGTDGSGGNSGSGGSGSGGVGSGGNGSGGVGSGGKVGSGGSGSGGMGSGGVGSGGKVGSGGAGTSTGGVSSQSGGTTGAPGGQPGHGGSTTAAGGRTNSGGHTGAGGAKGTGAGGATATGAGGAAATGTFAAVAQLLGTSCGTSTCHDGTKQVDLRNNTGLYARLVNGMPGGSATKAACKTMTLVVPNSTAGSLISNIVMAPVTACSNSRMPDDCSTTSATPRRCLTTAQIATIDSWIEAGAPM